MLHSPTTAARRTDELSRAISELRHEPRLTRALRLAASLRARAARAPHPDRAVRQLDALTTDRDGMMVVASLHALGAVPDPSADAVLARVLLEAVEPYAMHAAWALATRRRSAAAAQALEGRARRGGLGAMLAAQTLAAWEGPPALLQRAPASPGDAGLVVIQPFLHARLDRHGSALGVGDAGGIASLLRSLGSALALLPTVDRVITVTRRHAGETALEEIGRHHDVHRIEFGGEGPVPVREAWVHYPAVEQALLALGESLRGQRVVWHLRMADVGSLAAAAVARRLRQPFVFTAAPDPHTEIDALQARGLLDRQTLVADESRTQYWFRARLVEHLTEHADRLVLLPRPTIQSELTELVGVSASDLRVRATIVAEGVDVAEIERGRARWLQQERAPMVEEVRASLPPARRALPWLLTVGRLHAAKGVDRLVEAVVRDPALAARVNVVVVGGDLSSPTPDERAVLDRVHELVRGAPAGLVSLTGHLPPSAVVDLMVHTAEHDGAYVCASDKEEFGLAVVEALAAGAAVVAPQRGGPRTYVIDGVTGSLCDTTRLPDLREAIEVALRIAPDRARARLARERVAENLGIGRMATALAALYEDVVPASGPR